MDDYEKYELYDKAVELWGQNSQIMMAVEEMAELTQKLSHYTRKNKKVKFKEMASEIADVRIMLEQLECMFSISDLVETEVSKIKQT